MGRIEIVGGAVKAVSRTHRTPETTPMISARHDSTLPTGPPPGSPSGPSPGGHTEKYSPPGPNLHTGSIRLFLSAFILDTSEIRGAPAWVACASFYRPRLAEDPNKNRTKLCSANDFFPHPFRPSVRRDNMGRRAKKEGARQPAFCALEDEQRSLMAQTQPHFGD